jgi:hypothetical protein
MAVEHQLGMRAAERKNEPIINIAATAKQVDASLHHGRLSPPLALGQDALPRCQLPDGRHEAPLSSALAGDRHDQGRPQLMVAREQWLAAPAPDRAMMNEETTLAKIADLRKRDRVMAERIHAVSRHSGQAASWYRFDGCSAAQRETWTGRAIMDP